MSFEEIFIGFLVALAAGALIGLERQQDKAASHQSGPGGVRTFPLIALTGALAAFASNTLGIWPFLGALIVIGSFLAISFYKDRGKGHSLGITTPIAALITFLLGAFALLPDLPLDTGHRYLLIVACAAVVMALLSFKEPLHQAVQQVSNDDIYATAKFVILALVVLPLLPNRTFGPLDILNPFHIGLMVVLVAGVSFLGYIATRLSGSHGGLLATGFLGGLVSSTAVTVSMAEQSKQSPSMPPLAGLAILAASSTMFARTLLLIAILNIDLFPHLLFPLGAMMMVGYGMVFFLYRQSHHRLSPDGVEVSHRNPFELAFALKFGLLYSLVLFIAKGAQLVLGDLGLYASSILAGSTDVDAITLSMVQFHLEGLASETAMMAITLASMTNTFAKTLLAFGLGGWPLARAVGPAMAFILAAGGATIYWEISF